MIKDNKLGSQHIRALEGFLWKGLFGYIIMVYDGKIL